MAARIARVDKAYVRTYRDNGQVTAYVEWTDNSGRPGRTESEPGNAHMQALLARAEREGHTIEKETW